jgi:PAS domain S-box-containing protein
MPLRDAHGNIVGTFGVSRDLTARKLAEEALHTSEERFRRLFEDCPIGIAFRGPEREFALMNKSYCDFLGLSEAEIIRRGPKGLLHPDDFESSMALSARLRSGEIPMFHMEQRYMQGDNTVVWSDTRIIALRDNEGRLLYTIAWLQDITERKRAEEALQASERRLQTVMEEAPVAISISRAGQVLYANQRCLKMFGFKSAVELGGHTVDEHWSPEWRPIIRERAQQRSLGLPAPTQYEGMGQRQDGSLFPLEISVAAVTLPDGGANIAFLTDITERRRAQEEKQQSLEQLRALATRLQNIREEESKRLAREIHDQLGQALTALKVDVSFLLSELPGGPGPWSRRTSSIAQLIDQTIQTVREISSQLRPGMLDHLGLAATVEWAVEDFGNRTGIKCRLDLTEEELALDSDRATAIYRILQELLTNVARHAAATEVEVQLEKQNHDVVLKVRDNGKGMAREKLGARESLGILGMRERALAFGGELVFGNEPGTGTSVRVRIPEAGLAF